MPIQSRPFLRQISLKRERIESFEHYPFNIPAVRELDSLDFHPDVTFFVGDNGSGKSTLLEAIALALGFGPEGGSRNMNFQTAETVSSLWKSLKLVRSFAKPRDGYFLRAESFFTVASEIEKLDAELSFSPPIGPTYYGVGTLHGVSHGESFMAMLRQRLNGCGLYLFDEPEAALSPVRQLACLARIHELVRDNSQFIIATHSPILLAYPNAKIMLFDSTGLSDVKYEDTEHYAITRDFLNHYPKMLAELMRDVD